MVTLALSPTLAPTLTPTPTSTSTSTPTERRARLLAPQGHVFGDARASSLSDLVQGSLMLKFNKAKRKAEKEMMEQAAGPN